MSTAGKKNNRLEFMGDFQTLWPHSFLYRFASSCHDAIVCSVGPILRVAAHTTYACVTCVCIKKSRNAIIASRAAVAAPPYCG